ncbi:thiol reductant ABC exporter subunit CydD [Arthrobacter agilis]|uniref:thiol reductant ABC exporter subunit CydD n=1 Tax=Arthrobacter agilis TaxID=37921 RepID=UPI002780C83A|nr:thiol reductant ABC exporter subunit CydD [Arthrobacter agilis]MDQ0734399.1 ATP-binding cassette subfamily C protein CydCD [Arthrobacter agilis]
MSVATRQPESATGRVTPLAALRAGGPAGATGARGSASAVYLLGVLAAARAAGLVLMAQALALGIASLADGALDLRAVLVQGVLGAGLRTVAAWGQDATAARLALGAKEGLREAALLRVLDDGGTTRAATPGSGQGALAVLLTRGLDGLDKYYTQYLPALVTCAAVPLLIGARILLADWVSALIIVLTVPLVPVFMALIGHHTQERTQQAAAALGRLSDHLLELARGLPVLVGLGRAAEQTRALREIADSYTARTMTTLRTVFLSSLALELISTISVAVVAVFAGVRLIHGDLGLETALVALILAPECYGPLRDVGAAHHASEDGEEAGARVRAVIDAPPVGDAVPAHTPAPVPAPAPACAPSSTRVPQAATAGIRVEGLTARYDGVLAPVVERVTFDVAPGSVLALRGPSGSGKSTLMRALAGGAAAPAGLRIQGRIDGLPEGSVAWVPQHPELLMETVRAELALYAGLPADAPAIPEQLAAVDAAGLADRRTGELSPGELRRVAVARALLRAQDPAVRLLLLDEPTAHVDEDASRAIRRAILARRPGLSVLLIAHDDETAALAENEVRLDLPDLDVQAASHAASLTGSQATVHAASQASLHSASQAGVPPFGASAPPAPSSAAPASADLSPVRSDAVTATAAPVPAARPAAAQGREGTPDHPSTPAAAAASDGTDADWSAAAPGRPRTPRASWLRSGRDVLALVRPWDRRFLAAAALGLGASVFAVALTALSGWLIVRAAEQPPILYLLTAIVGVRFFGIGRSLLRYEERLWLHRAVFHRADDTRLRLWSGLLRAGRSWRTIARGSGGIERLVGDIDELRDISARALLPFLTSVLTALAALVTTAVLHPAALGWQALAVGVAVVVAPIVAVARERAAGAAAVQLRADALERVTGLLRAAPDLRVNGAHRAALAATRHLDHRASVAARRSAAAAGAATAVIVAACCAASLGILAVSAGLPAGTTAVLVLMQLALIEPFVAGASAVQHWGALSAVVRRLQPRLGPSLDPLVAGDVPEVPAPARRLDLEGAAVGYEPGRPVVTGVDMHLVPGSWTGLTGPSGSGKSTLIGALLGFLPLEAGRLLVDGVPHDGSTPRIAWCPQESHLFTSTLRSNLQLARSPGDPASDEELERVLAAVGLTGFVAGLEHGLDAQAGPGGSRLSGGQRQRLAVARALLTRSGVVLLDEPTAHLDADGARSLLEDLRRGLPDTAVLLVTHDPDEAALCDEVVTLPPAAVTTPGHDRSER